MKRIEADVSEKLSKAEGKMRKWEYDPRFATSLWIGGRWAGSTNVETFSLAENIDHAKELIAAVNAYPAAEELYKALDEITRHLEDVVETAANHDTNNWNGFYLPKFAELAPQARAAMERYQKAKEGQ